MRSEHVPVALERTIELLSPALVGSSPLLIDATLGLGGHTEELLKKFPTLHVMGIDRDKSALEKAFAAHGIGFIKLDVDNPADSQVLIPARERDEIDWDMANRLATENRDFLEYVKLVKQFYQTGEARPADWDVPELDD